MSLKPAGNSPFLLDELIIISALIRLNYILYNKVNNLSNNFSDFL